MNIENFMMKLFFIFFGIILIFMILLVIIGTPLSIYDSYYIKPHASEKANEYCVERGFDFYEDYVRIGFLSKEPVAIICKYVDQYRDIDFNLIKSQEVWE